MNSTPLALRRFSLSLPVFLSGLLLLWGTAGCWKPPVEIIEDESVSVEDCNELLDNVLPLMEPEILGQRGDRTRVVQLLNQWIESPGCDFSSLSESLDEEDLALLNSKLPSEAIERIQLLRFVDPDVGHVRDRLFDRTMTEGVATTADGDAARVRALFDHVVRNVALVGDPSDALPLSTYDIRLFGRARAEDRAWVFGDLLKQLRLDSFIIRPQQGPDEAWWVGVAIGSDILLFDMTAGIPVPSREPESSEDLSAAILATTLAITPATLAEAVADPTILTDYRPDLEPIAAEEFKPPRIELIASLSDWTAAMDVLEQSLPGEMAVLLYEPLHDTEAGKGLINRVADAGGDLLDANDITIWNYPEQQIEAAANLSETNQQRFRIRSLAFDAPLEEGEGGKMVPVGAQRVARQNQLAGRYNLAVSKYTLARIDFQTARVGVELPVDLRMMINGAGDDAFYWIAACQFARGKYPVVITTCENYIKEGGAWIDEARRLIVLSVAAQGNLAEAVKLADEFLTAYPNEIGLRVLRDKWQAKLDGNAEKETEEEVTEETEEENSEE
ncbi:tetratricopeptide repeat protein [Calycomorphotria hydatis]|uniref:Tetratricopeptide repeat protein n=1 Tax=Calycomorphotria hydatis TaxID=2528027 RepID=A0A517T3Z0_9PLAN|nr:hypothetical protein [Calycomorphotria hydatis]QDT63096.1 hypothetical protein V22_02960 [Calycomorphotria hydatis]